jgi:hypothetical protein
MRDYDQDYHPDRRRPQPPGFGITVKLETIIKFFKWLKAKLSKKGGGK